MELESWRRLAFDKMRAGFLVLDKPRYGRNIGRLVMTKPSTLETFVMPELDRAVDEVLERVRKVYREC